MIQAAPTAQQCEDAEVAKVKDAAKRAKLVAGDIIAMEMGKELYFLRFTCLPDA